MEAQDSSNMLQSVGRNIARKPWAGGRAGGGGGGTGRGGTGGRREWCVWQVWAAGVGDRAWALARACVCTCLQRFLSFLAVSYKWGSRESAALLPEETALDIP